MASTRNVPTKIYDIQAHAAKVTCLDIGQKGPVLVTGGQDRNVNLWTFGNENCLLSLTGHNAALECVKFAYSDDFVYSSDSLGVIKRWDLVNNSCSTFYGHMKPVKTIDMHPTSNQYFVSGSNDTVIILWDVRTESAMKRYRGHMANVNSVKFSPDGFWIASAGSEGAVTIWDIRMSKQIMEFIEPKISPALCVQYHPEHLLMACGRNDGTVDLYDLEEKKLITRLDKTSSMGCAVKCVTFDESGGCLFAGTANGVSVIGWEPDEEFDHVESTWSLLGDIKILANKLYCGAYDMNRVEIYDLKLSHIKPFYNPMNTSFTHNQSSRKSFSRSNAKMHLSIGSPTKTENFAMDEEHACTSPEISIEFESIKDENQPMIENTIKFSDGNSYSFADLPLQGAPQIPQMAINIPQMHSQPLVNSNPFVRKEMEMYNIGSDLDYYPCKNVSSDPEKEDFPVNSAQPPDYAPKMSTISSTTVTKTVVSRQKIETQQVRRPSPPNMNAIKTGLPRKMSNASRSTLELNKIGHDDLQHHNPAMNTFKKPMSRGTSPVRNYATLNNKIRKSESTAQISNVKNNQNRFSHHPSTANGGGKIEIYTKPVRSKTVYDMKSVLNTSHMNNHQPSSHLHHIVSMPGMPISSGPNSIPLRYPSELTNNEEYEIITMMNGHETVHPKLSSRASQLSFIRNITQKGDINAALKMAAMNDKMPDSNILVDLLGTILEQSSTMNLDMCVILLPKIHEVLYNGENKFHCARACETLRIILQTFLPIIRENTYGGCAIGVDVSREERVNKCKECREWLLRIRCLPEKSSMNAKILQHVKSMIVDI